MEAPEPVFANDRLQHDEGMTADRSPGPGNMLVDRSAAECEELAGVRTFMACCIYAATHINPSSKCTNLLATTGKGKHAEGVAGSLIRVGHFFFEVKQMLQRDDEVRLSMLAPKMLLPIVVQHMIVQLPSWWCSWTT